MSGEKGQGLTKRVGLAITLSLLAVLILQLGLALAHSRFKTANIIPDSTITTVPATLNITFTEDISVDFSKVSVLDSSGKQVDKGDQKIDGANVILGLGILGDGTYTVKYHTYTEDDGGVVNGSYTFTVATGGTPSSGSSGNTSEDEGYTALQGGSVSIKVTGFTAQEKLLLWTTNPEGNSVAASYLYADNQGNFSIKLDTGDSRGLAAAGNYTTLIDNYDAAGNDTQYWYVILKQPPALGQWHITFYGSVSKTTQVIAFNVIPGK